jgi:hypothetical protein
MLIMAYVARLSSRFWYSHQLSSIPQKSYGPIQVIVTSDEFFQEITGKSDCHLIFDGIKNLLSGTGGARLRGCSA